MRNTIRLLFVCLAGLAVVAPAGVAAPEPASSIPRLGEFALHFSPGTIEVTSEKTTTHVLLSGPGVSVTSPRYDMSAQRIEIAHSRKTAQRPEATDATATGGVHVVVREPEFHRATKAFCDKATYASVAKQGRVNLIGHVRFLMQGPQVEGSAELTGDSGSIEFAPGRPAVYRLSNGEGHATPREPAPKAKAQ